MTLSGALRFGRYSFPPNRLGYCGPADHGALLEYVATGQADAGLVDLARRFEGAYPYLVLIAHANGIADPFDDKVVEAYWIGNRCLGRVTPPELYASLDGNWAPKIKPGDFRWLTTKLLDHTAPALSTPQRAGPRPGVTRPGASRAPIANRALPHHNFHVFDIYTRAGLMHGSRGDLAIATMDSCRISWGRVSTVSGDTLVVERPQLCMSEGKLCLSAPRTARVARQAEGRGFVGGARPGEYVSVHWDWACEVLAPTALSRLRAATERCLALANETM
ncbi:MAG: DUF6390 family protein [Acidimicrobiales bacterium]